MKKLACPPDFAHWCVVETLRDLQSRYNCGNNTLDRWIAEQPPAVRFARRERIAEALRQSANRTNRAKKAARGRPATREETEAQISTKTRDDDRDFVVHFAHVAVRNKWAMHPLRTAAQDADMRAAA